MGKNEILEKVDHQNANSLIPQHSGFATLESVEGGAKRNMPPLPVMLLKFLSHLCTSVPVHRENIQVLKTVLGCLPKC